MRREQYRRAENDEQTAEVARSVVIAKVANCADGIAAGGVGEAWGRGVCGFGSGGVTVIAADGDATVAAAAEHCAWARGDAARVYVEVFDHLIVEAKDAFCFWGGAGGHRWTI